MSLNKICALSSNLNVHECNKKDNLRTNCGHYVCTNCMVVNFKGSPLCFICKNKYVLLTNEQIIYLLELDVRNYFGIY
jgi:hypothetical protein